MSQLTGLKAVPNDERPALRRERASKRGTTTGESRKSAPKRSPFEA